MPHGRRRKPVAFGRQLALLTVCALIVPAQLYLALPLGPFLEDAFRISPAAASWATSAFALAYAFGFLFFGPWSERVGRRRVLTGGMVGLAITTAGASLAPNLAVLIIFRVTQGLMAATLAPVALIWVTEKAPARLRSRALAILTTGLLGAGLMGQVYGTGMLAVVSWRWMLMTAAGAYLLLAWLLHESIEEGHDG